MPGDKPGGKTWIQVPLTLRMVSSRKSKNAIIAWKITSQRDQEHTPLDQNSRKSKNQSF